MEEKVLDWKDVAQKYYDKSIALAILIVLFAFIISPSMDVKPQTTTEVKTVKSLTYVPEEVKRQDKPPEPVAPKQQINIVIDTEIGGGDISEGLMLNTIEGTSLDAWEGVNLNAAKDEGSSSGREEGRTVEDPYFDEEPFPTSSPQPEYPKSLESAGITGSVVLTVEVFEDGSVGAVRVKKSSGVELLDRSAVNCLKKWKFEPAKANGKAVAVWVEQVVNFQ